MRSHCRALVYCVLVGWGCSSSTTTQNVVVQDAGNAGGSAAGGAGVGGSSNPLGTGDTGGTMPIGGSTSPNGGTTPVGGSGAVVGTCGEVELLTNGNFDSASLAPWTAQSALDVPLLLGWTSTELAAEGITPHSLNNLVRLGWVNNEVALLSQTVSVPASAVTLKVTGFIQIRTLEDPSTIYDRAYVEFAGLPPIHGWTNQDVIEAWTAFSYSIDATTLQGQAATFRFRATTDDNTYTAFYFDNISVVASQCAN